MNSDKLRLQKIIRSLQYDFKTPINIVNSDLNLINQLFINQLPSDAEEMIIRSRREIMFIKNMITRILEKNRITDISHHKNEVFKLKEILEKCKHYLHDRDVLCMISDGEDISIEASKDFLGSIVIDIISSAHDIFADQYTLNMRGKTLIGRRRTDNLSPLCQIELEYCTKPEEILEVDDIQDRLIEIKNKIIAMDGDLFIRKKGYGFYFCLTLQNIRLSQQLIMKSSNYDPNFVFKDDKYNILIVDDEEEMRELLCSMLKKYDNFNVAQAGNGLEALLLARKGFFHFAVIDCYMPKLGGFELIHYFQDISPETKIIFISGGTSIKVYENSKDINNVSHFLEKPIDIQDLMAKIEALIPKKD